MKGGRRLAIVAFAVASGFAVGSFATTGAATPAPSVSAVTVTAGDTYMMVATRLAPGASTNRVSALAHALARRNGGTDSTPINSALTKDLILFYLPSDIPGADPATTTSAPTTTGSTVPVTTQATTTTTTTPAPATTTTSTTIAPTTSTMIASTTTTRPTTGAPGCGLTAAAFCETFDAPHGGGSQTGDLDPTLWGVSRVGDWNSNGVFNGIVPSHNACSGGGTTGDPVKGLAGSSAYGPATAPPADARICNGQYVESVNDGGGVSSIHSYPKQPFNFTNRTGKVVFDVSADSGGTHAAWPEFVITDEPVPGVRRSISFQEPAHAVNEIGFAIDTGCPGTNTTGVGVVFSTVNGVYNETQGSRPNCITKGSSTQMNHFEVRLSQTHLEVWGTDAGSKTLKQLAVENINLGFTQGLVWLDDVHYNARKGVEDNGNAIGTQYDHSFAWDNLGFDGPKTYRDLGFDAPYANVWANKSINGDAEINEGYDVGGDRGTRTLKVTGVDWKQTPTKAKVVLNAYTENQGVTVTVSLNGHAIGSKAIDGYMPRSVAIDLPSSDAVKGTNTLTFTMTGGYGAISNVSLILVAGAPVP